MSVYQNKKNNKWYFNIMIEGRRYHRLVRGAQNKKQAEKAQLDLEYEITHGNIKYAEKKKHTTLKEAIDLFLAYSKTNKRSYAADESYCKKFLEEWSPNVFITEITPQKVEIFKEKQKKKVENSTINRYLEALSKMFNLCVANELIQQNPLKDVVKLRQKNFKIRFLTKDEENKLFKAIDSKHPFLRPIVTCALQTGMRRGEILKLKWSCVNITHGYIELLETKSGKARKIPISNKLLEELRQIKAKNKNKYEYVFINPETKKPYVDIKISFKDCKDDAGIENFRFHDLRHTAATRMVECGIDLVVVKEILGHADIKTTMRYAHPVPEVKKKAIEALNDY